MERSASSALASLLLPTLAPGLYLLPIAIATVRSRRTSVFHCHTAIRTLWDSIRRQSIALLPHGGRSKLLSRRRFAQRPSNRSNVARHRAQPCGSFARSIHTGCRPRSPVSVVLVCHWSVTPFMRADNVPLVIEAMRSGRSAAALTAPTLVLYEEVLAALEASPVHSTLHLASNAAKLRGACIASRWRWRDVKLVRKAHTARYIAWSTLISLWPWH